MNRPGLLRAVLGIGLAVASALALRDAERHVLVLAGVELLAGLLFAWPRTTRLGGVAMLIVMVLAALLHGFRGELPALPLVVGVAILALWPRSELHVDDPADQLALDIVHLRAPGGFDHLAHVRVARVYLQRLSLGDALERFSADLRRYATAKGAAGKFHQTTTVGFILAIRGALATSPESESFEAFLERNPHLRSAQCIRELYSSALMDSELARRNFVLPDRVSVSQRSVSSAA